MNFCETPPIIFIQFGDLAITTHSIPSLIGVPAYLLLFLFFSIRHKVLGWVDAAIVVGFIALQLLLLHTETVSQGHEGLPGYALLAPFMLFLAGYAVWRLLGKKPLSRWPWYRFGFVCTLALLLADIGMGLTSPVVPGTVWQLGGACFQDALLLGPPLLVAVFYGFLDCHSPWVFCSQKCVRIGQCRFEMDGKTLKVEKSGPAEPETYEQRLILWKDEVKEFLLLNVVINIIFILATGSIVSYFMNEYTVFQVFASLVPFGFLLMIPGVLIAVRKKPIP